MDYNYPDNHDHHHAQLAGLSSRQDRITREVNTNLFAITQQVQQMSKTLDELLLRQARRCPGKAPNLPQDRRNTTTPQSAPAEVLSC